MPTGFLIDLFAKSKEDFKEGRLTFRDKEFSIKILQIAQCLKSEFKKSSYTLQGLRMWAMDRTCVHKKEIDFEKLFSRLKDALRNGQDRRCNGREDFYIFVEETYSRL